MLHILHLHSVLDLAQIRRLCAHLYSEIHNQLTGVNHCKSVLCFPLAVFLVHNALEAVLQIVTGELMQRLCSTEQGL